jgi:hypothetical protein
MPSGHWATVTPAEEEIEKNRSMWVSYYLTTRAESIRTQSMRRGLLTRV